MRFSKRELSTSKHARERLLERYGLHVSHEEVVALIVRLDSFLKKTASEEDKKTVSQLAEYARSFPTSVKMAIQYQGVWLPVIYMPTLRVIKSVLPQGELPKDLLD